VPEITARAGLTTRTFFRHFAGKREVLFINDEDLLSLASRMIAEAPAGLTPIQIIEGGSRPSPRRSSPTVSGTSGCARP
jgi:AcrR family transcriptional regulator